MKADIMRPDIIGEVMTASEYEPNGKAVSSLVYRSNEYKISQKKTEEMASSHEHSSFNIKNTFGRKQSHQNQLG